MEATKILIVIDEDRVEQYMQIFKEQRSMMDVVELKSVMNNNWNAQYDYKMVLMCLDNVADASYWLWMKKTRYADRAICIIDEDSSLRELISESCICYESETPLETVLKGLVDALNEDNALPVDHDVVSLCYGSEILCHCCEGTLEEVVESISTWKSSKGPQSDCIFYISGDVTLGMADEIVSCATAGGDEVDNIWFGANFEDTPDAVRVFTLWKCAD